MSALARRLILLFAIAGLFFAGASTWVHYKLLTQPNYSSPCDINATFNCSQVYLSRFGSVRGIPVAIGGLLWFGLVALIAWFGQPKTEKTEKPSGSAGAWIFVLATIGLGVILYLAYASIYVLKTGCILCIGTYVAVVAIFLISGASASTSVMRLPGQLAGDIREVWGNPTKFLAAILVAAGVATLVALFPREGTIPGAITATTTETKAMPADFAERFKQAWLAQPRVDLGIPADGAKVIVVKFNDWQCPMCRQMHYVYKPILDRFEASDPGLVKLVIKDYPLNTRCNFSLSRDIHQAACEMSTAVRIARDKGKAEEMINWIFSAPDPQAWTAAEVKKKATEVTGITEQEFDKEFAARLPAIRRDIADGVALHIGGTPTFYVNGVLARTQEGYLPAELFELAIRAELERTK